MKIRFLLARIVRRLRIGLLYLKGYKNIDSSVVIETGVNLDKMNPMGIHIGSGCLIGGGTSILSHEHIFVKPDGSYYMKDTYIGKNCFIGIRSIICPGVHIGDQCVIGAGSVVTKDIPAHSVAAGVPAKVVKTGIDMNDHARLTGNFRYKK